MPKQYWLLKTEPSTFSFQDLEKEGWTHWDGVRNFQARNNLAEMKVGDLAFIYHSIIGKEIVGIATVAKTAYPDPSDDTGKWIAVRLEPVKPLNQSVTLETIKNDPNLINMPLIKHSRLSVMPIEKSDFEAILKLSKTKL